jgi:tRNA 2-thiouridine synthesizing protein E
MIDPDHPWFGAGLAGTRVSCTTTRQNHLFFTGAERKTMNQATYPSFDYAPEEWSLEQAEALARAEDLILTHEHWETFDALQQYFARNDRPNPREIHDALDERFHNRGGIRYLYTLFPGGPIAQGGRLAGIEPPAGAEDKSFGSVQ